ncbi:phosphoenolpyruvate synthase [Pseudofulvimonas gallinarii]|uniref:Phosphoenolpyruvate synthase n=1 Tax=Pseudofulvimonas gallinarii TaxID=634155 RepID=A0A4R3LLT2_9GAMM|nr:phosphoenolpyruvate synthase [Pseudofulvimonas gallinarii]TCT01252.1 phosphoenolpyruvate synthase [Pseudofulvimonas gallinarii]THD15014.1 phosphoenolpyruvate synthase [Pseudofulvimonas gallinarii]
MSELILWLDRLRLSDLTKVGGKNASLGEMIGNLAGAGVSVPGGFATTSAAFQRFLADSRLEQRIADLLAPLDVDDVEALMKVGKEIREFVVNAPLPADLDSAIRDGYRQMCERAGAEVAVAVRSSATAEDLPDASFAGQQETFLNVQGEDAVVQRVKDVFASLYNDRAIAYRVHHGFKHEDVFLSAGIQQMVRSDLACSGVLFTLDTESGFRDVVFITGSYGLGEMVVQGAVNPDEFYVHKPTLAKGKPAILRRTLGAKQQQMVYAEPGSAERVRIEPVAAERSRRYCLSNQEVEALARQALIIEQHYGRPMDIEWAKDGVTGELFIVQARPETVKSRARSTTIERYHLERRGEIVCEGRAIGQRIGTGVAKVVKSIAEMNRVQAGDILVTDMTDPDWEPVMKRAAAIVTNRGGRTCHAAIIARELGIPAVVGCGNATTAIADGSEATVSCAEGDTGFIYAGILPFERSETEVDRMPEAPLKIMMNVGNPERAFDFAMLPHRGIGLARLEFIIERQIGVHPHALLALDEQPADIKAAILDRIAGYDDPVEYYVDRLKEGIATLTAAFAPHPVIVRLSDFKSNEYANLLGGRKYEPHEENPMIGFRGASRYVDDAFRACFALECQAVKRVRDDIGLDNCWVMIPFVRTVDEARHVIDILAENGLRRGENGLKIIMMCEVPSNALLADQFLDLFDGFSIGSNDLTQLTLGLDRDSGLIAHLFDERNEAVKKLLSMAISACRERGKYIGICGQGPSDHPDLAEWLMDQGIESVSLNPDTVVDTWLRLARRRNA